MRLVALAYAMLLVALLDSPLPGGGPGGLPVPERPLEGVREIVFAVRKPGPDGHWYANFGYYAEDEARVTWVPGGRLCVLDVTTGRVRTLIDDPEGGVRDPALDHEGRRILFSWRRSGTTHYHLWSIGVDGEGLRRLTSGEYDDIEPCWLPDGDIVFVSSRAKRWVNCWLTQVATLHRCRPDGSGIRAISSNNEHDNTPWVLPDGRVLYQRWEYVDRSQVHYHHLWTTNPDGTGQMVYYGNQAPGVVMIDAKPIPGTDRVVAIFSPGHGRREHDGALAIVDPTAGPDAPGGARYVRREPVFRDPWALSDRAFLVARASEILLIDGEGRETLLHSLSPADRRARFQCHEPRPVLARPRERVIPPRARPGQTTGRLVLSDVYEGRNMADVRRGEIRKLLVLETLPKPINYTGGMDPLTYGGSFTLERVVGTVPVEPDGSAYLEVPALRSFFFVALDEHDLSVKRMQSFLTVQPGEVTGCVGCHEQRTRSAPPRGDLMALRRPPSRIEPVSGVPDVYDFPRDVQPILDELCVSCHGYETTDAGGPCDGGIVLTGDRGPMFSHAYYTMTIHGLFSDGRNRPRSNYPPRAIGSSASRILELVDGSHHGVRASERQRTVLRLWIETGAPYPGTYAALGTGMIGGYHQNRQVDTGAEWPESRAAAEVIGRRCSGCHSGPTVLPRHLADECGLSFWQPSWTDPRLRRSRHIVFNLSRPERSLIVLAPLAREAGGLGRCGAGGEAVFSDRSDPGYRALLALCERGRRELERVGRFDMEGFRPRRAYLREMMRYGVIAEIPADDEPVDPYRLDQEYWMSLWPRASQSR